MLSHLQVYNYVLIEENQMTFSDKFNVFTGETGAGKSLLVDALNFVSGQRSSASIVGGFDSKARVEAVFHLPSNHHINQTLKDLDLFEEDQLIFSREMNNDGRSTTRVNGRVANLSTVRKLSAMVIDIHSQHETQYLLNQNNHLALFDHFAKSERYLEEFRKEYKVLSKIKKKKIDLLAEELNPETMDFARFQLKELNDLDPSLEDYDTIESRLNILKNYERYSSLYKTINRGLDKSMETLYDVLNAFSELNQNEFNSRFKDLYYQLDDLNHDFESESDELSFNEYEFDELNARMLRYNQMTRKYGSVEAMIEKKEELQNSLDRAEDFEYILKNIEKEIKAQKKVAMDKANELSKHRYENKANLEKKVHEELRDLMLDSAVFEVTMHDKQMDHQGIDEAYFSVAMNKGSQLSPLAKVASGGELSRLMLGLKAIFSKLYGIATIVFDEIDTGVSGKAGLAIGKKMKDLSKDGQVITITHLSSVAACANTHYLITKEEKNDKTYTYLNKVVDQDRIDELSIMMSGNIHDSSLVAAKQLLEKGQDI